MEILYEKHLFWPLIFIFFLVLVTPDNEDIYDVTHGYIVTLVFECHARYLCYK